MPSKFGPTRGRRECFHEIRTRIRTVKVEIRFDRNFGNFFAQLNGEEFVNPSIKKLEGILREEAEKTDSLQWERWISYELIDSGYQDFNSHEKYQDTDNPVVGITFECVDLSIPQEGVVRRSIDLKVDDKGNVEPLNERWVGDVESYVGNIWSTCSGVKLIRFTPDRWVALMQIQAVIIDARRKLGQLLDADDQDDVEVQLDSMTAPLLMTGPVEDESERTD